GTKLALVEKLRSNRGGIKRRLLLLNSVNGELIESIEAKNFPWTLENVAFTSDSKGLLIGNAESVQEWNLEQKQVVRTFTSSREQRPLYGPHSSLSMSVDGAYVAASAGPRGGWPLHIWNRRTEECLARPKGYCIGEFSPDGRFLAAAGGSKVTLFKLPIRFDAEGNIVETK
ncbi:MAG: WD40 repeat domain-containing protein, partial [Planctomycetales bacterium]